MKHWIKRTFKRTEWLDELVTRAMEEQNAFELAHPVPFHDDQRMTAIVQRAMILSRKHRLSRLPTPSGLREIVNGKTT